MENSLREKRKTVRKHGAKRKVSKKKKNRKKCFLFFCRNNLLASFRICYIPSFWSIVRFGAQYTTGRWSEVTPSVSL